ncbi:MAG TPA: AmmeMemoRadiSam system protein B [Candidatus Nanoarchaeia archaeon]|nr:AmmeMemoRadiSam system protein B [Candidatus Nanoarchaeia archaeon]
MPSLRRAVVAGSFYESKPEALRKQVEACFLSELGPGKLPTVNSAGSRQILGMVCPHAGYVYSGPVAANAYFSLAQDGKPETFVILGPNHTGYGNPLSAMRDGSWQTPLGNVQIDTEIADAIAEETSILDFDEVAHRHEHSIEVQLPFLQYLYGNAFKFVPICFLMQDLETAKEIGKGLAEVIANKNAVVIASSDFTHYESQARVEKKDKAALQAVEALDEQKFYSILEAENVSACGYAPIATLITYAKALGAKKADVLSHKTSGDITGDKSSVVGYASVIVKKSF